jgi:hypothetical protein
MSNSAMMEEALMLALEEVSAPATGDPWRAASIEELAVPVNPERRDISSLYRVSMVVPGVIEARLGLSSEPDEILLDRKGEGRFEAVVAATAPRWAWLRVGGARSVPPACVAYELTDGGLVGSIDGDCDELAPLVPFDGPQPPHATIEVVPERLHLAAESDVASLAVRATKHGQGMLGGLLTVAAARARAGVEVGFGADDPVVELDLDIARADLPLLSEGELRVSLTTSSPIVNRRRHTAVVRYARPLLLRDVIRVDLAPPRIRSARVSIRRADGLPVKLEAVLPASLEGCLRLALSGCEVELTAIAPIPRTLEEIVVVRDAGSGLATSVPIRVQGAGEKS